MKPHVKYWKHGMYAAEADGIISFGFSLSHAAFRWHTRWLAMEGISHGR